MNRMDEKKKERMHHEGHESAATEQNRSIHFRNSMPSQRKTRKPQHGNPTDEHAKRSRGPDKRSRGPEPT